MPYRLLPLLVTLLLVAACSAPESAPLTPADAPEGLLTSLDSATVRTHLAYLSDDALEGRGPGTPGESLAVAYIAEQMRAAGLQPAGDNGTFFQDVALLGSTPTPRGPLTLTPDQGTPRELTFLDDFIAATDYDTTETVVEAPLVFVGYGIDNPGYDWDDYKGMDVEDKILVMFVNDPIASDEEPTLFQGDTLTYNGRWTYKYEEARRRGAKGVLLIHTINTAGYPFSVLSNSAGGEQIQLATPPENPLALKGWITRSSAEALAEMAGTTLDAWFAAANDRAFEPQPLPVTARLATDYAVRRFSGKNVLGKLEGRTEPDEAIVYTAHHDHLGIGQPDAEGDRIYNGAVDNASGVAMLLSLAEAFGQHADAPDRTLIFASVTAEESGLLGAEHYARHPVLPLAQTIANINVDSGNVFGRTEDIVGIGAERSEMMTLLREAAAAESLRVTPDPMPNQGFFFRSDQLAFARGGVPAVFINTGSTFEGRPASYAREVEGDYLRNRCHQPGDEFDPSWPMGGIVQQMRVAARMGYALANSDLDPAWNEGEAFGETRAQSRGR